MTKQESHAANEPPSVADAEITPAHRNWMNTQIENALDLKRGGDVTYKSLDEMRRKFGL